VAIEEWFVERAHRRRWLSRGRIAGTVEQLRPILEDLARKYGAARATRGDEALTARSDAPSRKAYFAREVKR
jgi:hypothetical protein